MAEQEQTAQEKTCHICKASKPTRDFNRCSRAPGGFSSYCRECNSAYQKARYGVRGPKPRPQGQRAEVEMDYARLAEIVEQVLREAEHREAEEMSGRAKQCTRCQRLLPQSEFGISVKGHTYARCVDCR